MNEVKYLQSRTLCYNDRLIAKELGSSRSQLSTNQVFEDTHKTYNRTFSASLYKKWECADARQSMLYFPFLVFCLVVKTCELSGGLKFENIYLKSKKH